MQEKNPEETTELEGVETPDEVVADAAAAAEDAEESAAEDIDLDNVVLALLFSADEPISVRKMAAVIETATGPEVKASVDKWRRRLEDEAWSVRVELVAGGYQISSHPDFAPYIARLYSRKRKFRLSKAGLEVLAIIAYKQPVTRAEIESIRGVGSGGVVQNLMERSLIKITGKAKVLGAPFLYGTTPEFLAYLGLSSIKDLPSMEELEALLEKEAYPESALEDGSLADEVAAEEAADLAAELEEPPAEIAEDESDDAEVAEADEMDYDADMDDVHEVNDEADVDEVDEVNDEVDEAPVKATVAASARIGSFNDRSAPADPEADYETEKPSREEKTEAEASAPAKSPDEPS